VVHRQPEDRGLVRDASQRLQGATDRAELGVGCE
jgi:hypothetical protein